MPPRSGSSHKNMKKSATKQELYKEEEIEDTLETTSSTTELKKKIKKPARSPVVNSKLTRSKKKKMQTSAPQHELSLSEESLCKQHGSKIEFICQDPNCLRELCGYCILSHKEHINIITSVKDIVKSFLDTEHVMSNQLNQHNTTEMFDEIGIYYQKNMKLTETLSKKLYSVIDTRTAELQNQITGIFEDSTNMVENLATLKKQAPEMMNEELYSQEHIDLIKSHLKFQHCAKNNISLTPPLSFSIDNISADLQNSLNTNVIFDNKKQNLETTYEGIPKILHWFEWGKKRLNVYDIVTNTTNYVELDITFKIPSFSRSIILPNGHVYLLGGEEPEYYSRREIFMYDSTANDGKLHPKAPMPLRKFDFTLCYLNGCIYVLCGKDNSSEVVNSCERYSLEDNQWNSIAAVNKKRYAASAVGFGGNRIYLFGGRSDYSNTMVHEIEEYKMELNQWSVLNVNNSNLWVPVEVCACIQVSEEEILIFGGSDARIKDSHNSLIFKVTDQTFQKYGELKRAQVFVNAPFLYKNHIYALGNEYYMKQRNLHRFSLEKQEWSIIF